LLHLDLFYFEPQIAVEKYIAPTHLGEYSIASFFVEIVVFKCAFSKDPESIFHAIPCIVVEMTCAPHGFPLFSKLVYLASNFDMGFL
jgi:hypothetical protein